jgi:hypothetical protein
MATRCDPGPASGIVCSGLGGNLETDHDGGASCHTSSQVRRFFRPFRPLGLLFHCEPAAYAVGLSSVGPFGPKANGLELALRFTAFQKQWVNTHRSPSCRNG